MSASPAPPGGEFLAASPTPEQVSTPEEQGAEACLMAQTAGEFLRRDVLPMREPLEAQSEGLMRRLVQQAGTLGLLAGNVPVEYGGLALPKTTAVLLGETMALDLSFTISAGIHAGVALLPLVLFGTLAQKAQWLPRLARGEVIGAFALSEANAGSDALNGQTRAALSSDGTHYILQGMKQWVTNAGIADLFTVFAQADGRQFTGFLVERDRPGVSLGPKEKKLGLRGSSTRRLILDGVQIPVGNVIGEVGQGRRPALCALNMGRFAIAVTALGAAKDALGQAARYARERTQFGKALTDFGLTQHKLGEMAARIFALESMVFRTAGYWDRRPSGLDAAGAEEYAIECALLKFSGTEVQSDVVDAALQIHGGYGFSEAFLIARAFRDARVFRIFEGTNEICRLTVVDLALRRVQTGRLSLPAAESLAETSGDAITQIRQTLLSVLEQYQRLLGDERQGAQEVAAALADMMAGLYALESVCLRTQKMPQDGLAPLVVELLREEIITQTRQQARTALAYLCADDERHQQISRLETQLPQPLTDTVTLRRRLASAVAARGGYPWH